MTPPKTRNSILPLVQHFFLRFKCDPCRIHGFCTRVGLGILESHSGFGIQFIFGYEVEVALSIQLENGTPNEVEYE